MALYRTIMAVFISGKDGAEDKIIPAGVTSRLDGISHRSIAQLIGRDAIAEVSEPPLHLLPHWTARAARLAPLGINRPLQLIDADPVALSRQLRVRRQVIEEWQAEAKRLVLLDGQEVYG